MPCLVAAAAVALAGCAGTGGGAADAAPRAGASSGTGASSATGPTGEVTVLAAASLTDVFTQIAAQVEADHPGSTVTLSFAASSELVAQVQAGAPAARAGAAADRAARGAGPA